MPGAGAPVVPPALRDRLRRIVVYVLRDSANDPQERPKVVPRRVLPHAADASTGAGPRELLVDPVAAAALSRRTAMPDTRRTGTWQLT